MAEHDMRYAIALVRASRTPTDKSLGVGQYISWGAGPRASEWLVLAAKGHAALTGRDLATANDVQAMLKPVLRHRLVLNFNAEADGVTVDDVIDRLSQQIPQPTEGNVPAVIRKFISRA